MRLVEAFGLWDEEAEPGVAGDKPVQIAVVGRPNAGKSTLINRLIGEDRLLTGPEAGITRDSIAVDWHWRDRRFRVFRYGRPAAEGSGRGQARKACGRRCAPRHSLC